MRQSAFCSSICCLVAVLALTAQASAGPQTTQPGTTLRVFVILTDNGIKVTMFDELSSGGQTGLVPAHGGGVRGEVAVFSVRNKGKRPHSFAVLGKQTGKVLPGRKSGFSVVLLRRGAFPYVSSLDQGKKGFRGLFAVR